MGGYKSDPGLAVVDLMIVNLGNRCSVKSHKSSRGASYALCLMGLGP